MEIDAFTTVAQLMNFALLVWLLKRFLYKPLLGAMSAREDSIEQRLQHAAETETRADELAADFAERIRDLEEAREEMLAEARAESELWSRRMHDDLKRRVEHRETEWHQNLVRQATEALQTLRSTMRTRFVEVVRAALRDLADAELEERMIQSFLERVDAMDAEGIALLLGDEELPPPLKVVTTFDLDDATRQQITKRLRTRLGERMRLGFDTDASLVAGLELRCLGHRLGWNVNDYVETLEKRVREQLVAVTLGRADLETLVSGVGDDAR